MYPYVKLFGINAPVYSICSLIGAGVTILLFTYLLRQIRLLNKYMSIVPISLAGLFLGAKGFGILSKGLVNLYLSGRFDLYDSFFHSGIVYLGGLFGALLAIHVMCRFRERQFEEISDILGIIIPLFHAFGRVGCYFAGCCYGCEWPGFLGLPYRIGLEGEVISRLPTQLFEAGFELAIFVMGFIKYHYDYTSKEHLLLLKYLFSYSLFRYVIEFYRGDEIRGVFYGISFSQIICVMTLVCMLIYYIRERRVID